MENPSRLIFFSNEFPPAESQTLRRLYLDSKDKRHPHLSRFLEEATAAVRDEVEKLPLDLRRLVPYFESVQSLLADRKLRRGVLSGSIDGVLLCIIQIGSFIRYCETKSGQFNLSDLDNTLLAGLGLGLLVAATVSLAPSLEVLPSIGAQVISIAFRLGCFVAQVSQTLEPLDEEGIFDSWAYVVHGATTDEVQQELKSIHSRQQTPEAAKIFISAKSRTSVTISGPPSRLKELFRTSSFFRNRKSIPLPVYGGLCHAPHVYTEQDADQVVGSLVLEQELFSRFSVLAPSNGTPFLGGSASQLFQQIIFEILTRQIVWDKIVDYVSANVGTSQSQGIELMAFGNSLPIQDLQTALDSRETKAAVNVVDLLTSIIDVGSSSQGQKPRSPRDSKIAIVGMACRLPGGAVDPDTLWNILEEGLDVHRVIPQDRFDVELHYDPERKNMNASHTQFGCFVDAPGLFDAGFFNMSPREVEQTDPMQRLALVTAFEALERAGFVVGRTLSSHKTRVGTWYGQASDDYREVNTAQEIGTYFIPGGCRAFGPGRINYFFKFSGPSFSCDTACSSSLATIQAACTSLWNGEVDTVVAGGMNILTNSDAFAGLSNGHFLTKTPNACKTWDIDADGYCRADGVVSFVMKRLEDAEKDNDNILGVILAAATNHSADAVSITHPHAGSQAYLYQKVLERAGVDPFDVSYIEAHGTGTQAGDIQELTSVTDVFAPLLKRRSTKQPLHIGAVKSNVGHGEAVAGATALLKVLLMFEREMIPPHVGIKTALNPKLPTHMDQRNIRIPFEATSWPRKPHHKRLAMVNSFSAAGGNTSLLLEDGPSRAATGADPRPSHTVVVSAKSKSSLKGNIERLLSYLESHPAVHLSDLAYTTTARRQHYTYRFAFHVAEVDGLRTQLYSSLKQLDAHRPISRTLVPSVAFTFTGQGASFKSSNLQLFHHSPVFRSQILTLDALARRLGFLSFIPAIDGSHDKDHDHDAVITHIALTCMEIALARYWESLGVKPDVVLGHSLGEYAALCVAGVLSASDTICLVGKRAEMLQEKCTAASHGMLAVRASVDEVKTAAGDLPYEVACINGPKSTVLSGTWQDLEAVRAALIRRSHHCATIDVPFAFHSAQTDPILQDFEAFAREGIIFREPRIPIISPLLAEVICDGKTVDSTYLRKATRETCDFLGAVNKALEIGIIDKDVFWIEMGPHPVNASFLKATLGPNCVALPSLRRGEDNWTTLADSLATLHSAGLDVDWNEFHRPFEIELRLLDLPTYSWNNKNHWIQYNGDWALVKGNTFYENPKQTKAALLPVSSFRTSLVQAIIHEEFHGTSGIVTMQSDLMSAEFFSAAHGHNMNGCGVVTSSIHADIAYTLSEYMTKKLGTPVKYEHLNVANLKVVKGLVVQTDTSRPQLIRVTASTSNIANGINMQWHNTNINGAAEPEPFATATVLSGDADEYLRSWVPITHLVESRIETLQDMARRGQATQFSSKMAYSLFASSLVNYADKYRGMRSVVMHEFEAFADVQLTTEKGGIWTVPPYFIDSVAHLAGFVMNVTDAHDTAGNFCVTPGWQSMILAKRLEPGVLYRSYVKMIPSREDTGVFRGDVYIMRGREIVGMVGGIQFRRYPRILLDRFFSPPDSNAAKLFASSQIPPKVSSPKRDAPRPVSSTTFRNNQAFSDGTKNPVSALISSIDSPSGPSSIASALGSEPERSETPATETDRSPEKMSPAPEDPDSIAVKATLIIASQTGIDVADLSDNTRLGDVGVDSLMSLVIAERFRGDLDIAVNSSLFLEYPTLGALKDWLREYYN
ncbi:beta-ketoacyl synthase domain-containing protein [Colletotrichum abscissum]|uniref:Beta-ketoacyl synthase domain-containing protein n=1 Tax=Colletotrichum abscissum TaxID=1671311 RepID=A0A9P9XA50_9PEZI|nr:beta-ketoacyl synthase domain-containing protein [Colletotrichum abscissum]KAI3545136.1 beta-ketoacyl synthase domain-containing protein [Colletotrichum abscissum]KAK1492901.1 beta-ketoacyl synthase domain-containing protein [Colletotrichum abscissum]